MFLGPAGTHLAGWLPALAKCDLDLQLVTLHAPSQFDWTGPINDLSTSATYSKLGYFAAVVEIRKRLSKWQPDLLVCYYASSYGTLGMLSGFRPYLVATAGSDINVRGIGGVLRASLLHAGLRSAAGVICWSDSMKAAAARFVPASRIFVNPRGVPGDFFAPRALSNAEPSITCTRRFSKIFNHDVIVQACTILRARGVRFRLRLAGDGPELENMREFVRLSAISDATEILTGLRRSQIANLLLRSDIFLSLSVTDGAAASLFEAMAAGCYPVVSRIPANEAWISDRLTGRLVDPLDPNAVADALQEVIADRAGFVHATLVNRARAETELDVDKNARVFAEYFRATVRDFNATRRIQGS